MMPASYISLAYRSEDQRPKTETRLYPDLNHINTS